MILFAADNGEQGSVAGPGIKRQTHGSAQLRSLALEGLDAAIVDGSIATLTIVALAVGTISPTLIVGRHLARLVRGAPPEAG